MIKGQGVGTVILNKQSILITLNNKFQDTKRLRSLGGRVELWRVSLVSVVGAPIALDREPSGTCVEVSLIYLFSFL